MTFSCYVKLASAVGLMGAVYLAYCTLCEKFHKLRKYRLVGLITELNCYPVTSCMGMTTPTAYCSKRGLQMVGINDSQFIIAKEAGADFSRLSPRGTIKQFFSPLCRDIEASSDGVELHLNAPGDTYVHNLNTVIQKSSLKQIYRAENLFVAADMGKNVKEWLERVLHTNGVRLLCCIDEIKKITPGRSNFGNYVITTQESVEYINHKMKLQPPIRTSYFRPNIVISGCAPFEENRWKMLCIRDDVYLKRSCPDVRIICTPYNFHRQNEDFKPSWEPHKDIPGVFTVSGLNFLTTMGVNVTCVEEGRISVGDPVFAAV